MTEALNITASQPPKRETITNALGVERQRLNLWPTRLDVVRIIDRVTTHFAITPYKLGVLLGTPNRSTVYRWMAGSQRPSAYYFQKMVVLVLDRAEAEREKEIGQ
ncbi:MAG: hypothetical protein O3B65_00200 [Chloroflexi bacterium]|nr:hypothetical protein [Chloroflexota bacterium]